VTAKVARLPEHVLDAEVLQTDSGTWFAHDHAHTHPDPGSAASSRHRHRHDHRRRSHRGDYDHHPLEQAPEWGRERGGDG